jgi:hypothetical protein
MGSALVAPNSISHPVIPGRASRRSPDGAQRNPGICQSSYKLSPHFASPHAGYNEMYSAQPGPAAALAFYDFVALFQQALALAILALLLLLDIGTFVIGHDSLQAMISRTRP